MHKINVNKMKKIITLLFTVALLYACKTETKKDQDTNPDETAQMQEEPENLSPNQQEARRIAMANGAGNWDKVTQVSFTFNVDRGQDHTQRSWVWNPKTHDIKMTSDKDSIDYNRNQSMDSIATQTDKGFINDAFWLTAPLHLVWDESATVTVQDTATAPISKEMMKKITLTYPDEGGYTPGDAYDFYYGDDDMVKEWIYRRGNVSEFSMVTTWEDYEDFNGVKLAKTHHTADKKFKLYFTGVAVKMDE